MSFNQPGTIGDTRAGDQPDQEFVLPFQCRLYSSQRSTSLFQHFHSPSWCRKSLNELNDQIVLVFGLLCIVNTCSCHDCR